MRERGGGGYGGRDRGGGSDSGRSHYGGGGGGGYGGDRGGGGYERREQRQAPVKEGEEYDVEITDVAAKGDGVCKIQGFIVFVPGASKGDKCKIRISTVRNRFAIAEKVGESSGTEESEVPPEAEAEGDEEAQAG